MNIPYGIDRMVDMHRFSPAICAGIVPNPQGDAHLVGIKGTIHFIIDIIPCEGIVTTVAKHSFYPNPFLL